MNTEPQLYSFASWKQVKELSDEISELKELVKVLVENQSSQNPSDLLSLTQGREYIQKKYGLRCSSPQTLSNWMAEHPGVMTPRRKKGKSGAYYARAAFDELALLKQGLI